MDVKRFGVATIVGGLVLWGTGWLIFIKALGAFYAANAGSATGVQREAPVLWAIVLGNVAYAALVTYVLAQRSVSASIAEGAKVGAVVGFLMWCTADFVFYGGTNMSNLTLTIVDPFVEIVHGGLGGAAIAAVWAKMSAPTPTAG